MNSPDKNPLHLVGKRSAGPQGTQLFSAAELRQYASEMEQAPDGRASVHEPVLEGLSAGFEGRRFSLRSGRQTLGRGSNNDIVADDPSVSSAHAWIINQHGHYVIMNTLSTNGTFVNDKRIHEAILKHGDHIRLGQAEFVFLTRERGLAGASRLRWVAAGLLVLIALGAAAWWLL
ncbi:FHA domain-containing protein [Rhodanobacter sp. AS-Z3]|uniref:FHA domain-containing protein n=1 Tax=Rhodanobacter sp. AS-Z3 TaxID=3031330 RepID=UPI0024796D63|nr:FHA domain-containing protein [Rhodanobacter sp. AS-Z3]WEN14714.1 FHA domain-containing protein [Rhodanobacter sp. AS-Z3]